jgi:hypothetical protein
LLGNEDKRNLLRPFIKLCKKIPSSGKKIVTDYKNWACQYDPETTLHTVTYGKDQSLQEP